MLEKILNDGDFAFSVKQAVFYPKEIVSGTEEATQTANEYIYKLTKQLSADTPWFFRGDEKMCYWGEKQVHIEIPDNPGLFWQELQDYTRTSVEKYGLFTSINKDSIPESMPGLRQKVINCQNAFVKAKTNSIDSNACLLFEEAVALTRIMQPAIELRHSADGWEFSHSYGKVVYNPVFGWTDGADGESINPLLAAEKLMEGVWQQVKGMDANDFKKAIFMEQHEITEKVSSLPIPSSSFEVGSLVL